ncbi:MAG TPA: preprotein translocase subunit SecG [Candidatus Limisoma gallistercoris]|jgi:preprotein translocase subunit SecG|nr:preprotein translocase subunit SecG [Candidatus Limisoma gallistercoris]
MFSALIILILIASVLMIGIVLIQKSKGGGLASNFASSNQIMGVRKTNSFVEKATWTLAIVICVLSIISSFFAPKLVVNSRVQATPQEQTAAPYQTAAPAAQETPAQTGTPAPAAPAQK